MLTANRKILIALGLWGLFAFAVSKQGQIVMSGIYTSLANLIKRFEGFSSTPYKDSAGKWTIGYGHLIKPGESFSSITESQALDLLNRDTAAAQSAVDYYVNVPLSENQYNALISFVYNIGAGAFAESTLLKMLNAGEYINAANEFGRWVYSDGKVDNGLVTRRFAEKDLFLKGVV